MTKGPKRVTNTCFKHVFWGEMRSTSLPAGSTPLLAGRPRPGPLRLSSVGGGGRNGHRAALAGVTPPRVLPAQPVYLQPELHPLRLAQRDQLRAVQRQRSVPGRGGRSPGSLPARAPVTVPSPSLPSLSPVVRQTQAFPRKRLPVPEREAVQRHLPHARGAVPGESSGTEVLGGKPRQGLGPPPPLRECAAPAGPGRGGPGGRG